MLQNKKDFTLDTLIAAAYDSYLTWFEKPIPALVKAWDQTAVEAIPEDETRPADRPPAQVGPPLGRRLRRHLARRLLGGGCAPPCGWRQAAARALDRRPPDDAIATAPAPQLLQSLDAASDKIAGRFR